MRKLLFVCGLQLGALVPAVAQVPDAEGRPPQLGTAANPVPTTDLIDLAGRVSPWLKRKLASSDSAGDQSGHILWLPTVGFTPESGPLLSLTATQTVIRPRARLSVLSGIVSVTQKRQLITTFRGGLWTSDNHSFWLSDFRFLIYPQATFGLGTNAPNSARTPMDYRLVRLHQNYYRRIGQSPLYLGLGYHLNWRWGIEATSPEGQPLGAIDGYAAGVRGRSVSSGVVVAGLVDRRANPLRPAPGESFYSASLKFNLKSLGSDASYRRLQAEARRYLPLGRPGNLLALWGYAEVLQGGRDIPYLDLPATGWDTNNVTGRGYVQGRFRGTTMLYSEAEYRFNLTRSRLLGAVVFANAQSFRDPVTGFGGIAPAAGAGLRVCLSKRAGTYLAFDYGWGRAGNQGFWFNLGEVF